MRTPSSLTALLVTFLALLACKKESEKEPAKAAESAPAPATASAPAAAAVGGKAACIYSDGAWCAEFSESDADDKKMCDDAKGRWTTECPTANLIATCKGLSSTQHYKPGYTLENAKTMCSAPGDEFTPVA